MKEVQKGLERDQYGLDLQKFEGFRIRASLFTRIDASKQCRCDQIVPLGL